MVSHRFFQPDKNIFSRRNAFDHMASCDEVLLLFMVKGERGARLVGSSNMEHAVNDVVRYHKQSLFGFLG